VIALNVNEWEQVRLYCSKRTIELISKEREIYEGEIAT
jgi:hypothetical protein